MHCVYVPQFLYPFICRWTSRLLPCPSYCKQCCSELWSTRVFFSSGFLRVYALLLFGGLTAACQASLCFAVSQSLPKFMFVIIYIIYIYTYIKILTIYIWVVLGGKIISAIHFHSFKKYLFILLFIFVLWWVFLHCCLRAFSSCGEQGPLSSFSVRASHCGGLSCFRLGMWALVVSVCGLSRCGLQALELGIQ